MQASLSGWNVAERPMRRSEGGMLRRREAHGGFDGHDSLYIRKNDYICQILDTRWILLLTLRLLKD